MAYGERKNIFKSKDIFNLRDIFNVHIHSLKNISHLILICLIIIGTTALLSSLVASKAVLEYEILEFPTRVRANSSFILKMRLKNSGETFQEIRAYAYVYKGSSCYSGSRQENLVSIGIEPGASEILELPVSVIDAKEGGYKLKVKIFVNYRNTSIDITRNISIVGNDIAANRISNGEAAVATSTVVSNKGNSSAVDVGLHIFVSNSSMKNQDVDEKQDAISSVAGSRITGSTILDSSKSDSSKKSVDSRTIFSVREERKRIALYIFLSLSIMLNIILVKRA